MAFDLFPDFSNPLGVVPIVVNAGAALGPMLIAPIFMSPAFIPADFIPAMQHLPIFFFAAADMPDIILSMFIPAMQHIAIFVVFAVD